MSRLVNDGSTDPPKLRIFLNLDSLTDLRGDSIWPGLQGAARDERLLADGFEGVQLTTDEAPIAGSPLAYCGLDRINLPSEADTVAAKHAKRGDLCITVHLGWGLEDDDEVDRLVAAVLAASEKHDIPIFIETHRATITQDIWRTVQLMKRFPEARLNGDFSHYYCGQELGYGDWDAKMAFLQPIFNRVGFLHGRIASPGCMQVPIEENLDARPRQAHGEVDYLARFKEMWILAMLGFLRSAGPGDRLIFAPEILKASIYYARMFPDASGSLIEESDRYAQALIYRKLAIACFAEAHRLLADG